MVVQEDLGFFFASALAALPDVRAAGSTENLAGEPTPAALAELTQADMLQQIEN